MKNLESEITATLLDACNEAVSTIETLMREHDDKSPSFLMSLEQIKKAIKKAKNEK